MALWSDQPWEGGPWTQEAPSTPAKPGRMGEGWAGSEGRKRQQRKQARGPGLQTGLKGMRSGGGPWRGLRNRRREQMGGRWESSVEERDGAGAWGSRPCKASRARRHGRGTESSCAASSMDVAMTEPVPPPQLRGRLKQRMEFSARKALGGSTGKLRGRGGAGSKALGGPSLNSSPRVEGLLLALQSHSSNNAACAPQC